MTAPATAGSTEKTGTFEVLGADRQTIVIPPGRWHITTKARPERLMKNSLSKEARMIYACGDTGTMAFRQEVAIVRRGENGEPDDRMTKAWIMAKTGLSDRDYRRGFAELEQQGMALRRPIDPNQPLQNGNIELCFWAEPPAVKEADTQASRAWVPPSWVPESAHSILKRLKIRLPDDLDPGERSRLAEVYEREADVIAQSEKRLREAFNPPVAPPLSNKDERKERIERNSSSSSAVSVGSGPVDTEDPERRRRTSDPPLRNGQTTKAPGGDSPAPAAGLPAADSPGLPETAAALERLGVHEGKSYPRKLAATCREVCPDATDAEIADQIKMKAPHAKENLSGFLLTAVPKPFEGLRDRQRKEQEQAQRDAEQLAIRQAKARADLMELYRRELNDPDEETRRFARQGLKDLGEPVPRE